ncbi:AMP-binding protein [Novispirillum sp. DQ9]|uniref:AMP-binding protein n=1 Tax=Novispirillum sp. DQ9 TaxID=3398612 RepID=UPI003C7B63B6
MNIFSTLDRAAVRFAAHGALYRGEAQVATFAQVRQRALALAGWLRDRHPAGSRIVLASENDTRTVEVFYAAWAAGMAIVPLNPKLHPREIEQVLEDCAAAHLFVSAKIAAGLAPLCSHTLLGSPEYEGYFTAAPVTPAEVAPDDLAWLFYTSGTTGRSKGAMLSHRNLMAMTLAHLADVNAVDETMSLIHAAPMSHGSGLYILPTVAKGARQVVPASAGFDPAEYLDLTAVHPNCVSFLAPTMIHRLRQEMERAPRRHGIHTIIYGGAPMYVEDLKKALATFGPVFAQIYGQGEAPMTIATLRRADHAAGDDRRLGSVGTPYTGVEVRVVDEAGTSCPPGQTGEVIVRGDVVMRGYWNNPAATAEALRGGWLWTGDIGAFDDDGFLTLSDRSKDVIISGGSNIYPREVEEALLCHAAVSEVCVVGQPDPEWGENVVAFVVAAPGSDEDALRAELDALCLSRIARFKRPKDYVFLPDLPKSSYGKILKRELRRAHFGGG